MNDDLLPEGSIRQEFPVNSLLIREFQRKNGRTEAIARQARQRVVSDYDWARVERQMQALVAEIRIAREREAPRRGALR